MPSNTPQKSGARSEETGQADRADFATAAVLHELYADTVLGFVSKRVARRQEAERITAEVFVAAAAGLPRFHGDCSPALWLLEIARDKIAEANGRRRTGRSQAP